MDIHERRQAVIRRLIETRFGGNQAAFARAAQRESSYFTRVLETDPNKDQKRMTERLAAKLEAIPDLGLSPGELVDPQLDLRVREPAASYGIPNRVADALTGEVSIAHFETGGAMGHGVLLRDQPGVIQSWRVTREWIQKNVKSFTSASNLCIVTGFGDSMRPLFNPGDPLLVDIGIKSVDFDAIYFFRVDDEGFIKRLQRIPGEGMRVLSANRDNYEPWTVKPDMDFEVFGRVLKVWKGEEF